jgi:hypothetical protein
MGPKHVAQARGAGTPWRARNVLQEPLLFARRDDFRGAGPKRHPRLPSPATVVKHRLWRRLCCFVGQPILAVPMGLRPTKLQ